MGNLFSGKMFSFDFRKTSAWDYQRHLLRPWPTVTVTLHLYHDYVPCGPRLRWFWAIVPFDVDRDYAMWATITVKHKMRPTSQRNPGPHHNGISGPHPMESPAHIDRNTQAAAGVSTKENPRLLYATGSAGPATSSQRQLPTDQDYAVSTREYQTDQSSLKAAPTAARPCPRKTAKPTNKTPQIVQG